MNPITLLVSTFSNGIIDDDTDEMIGLAFYLSKRRRVEEEEQQQHQRRKQFLERKRKCLIISTAVSWYMMSQSSTFTVENRLRNREVNYMIIVEIINDLKRDHKTFTRMFRLSVKSFELVLKTIENDLLPRAPGGKNIIPPTVKLCVTLRFLAGGSYLDISFGYRVPGRSIHFYVIQCLEVIDRSPHPFINNIISPIYRSSSDLVDMEKGFAKLSFDLLRGTVAAGDGIIIRMQRPTNEEADGDVSSNYTRKGCYAYGLQVTYDP
jgi:hypothetical protein